MLPRPRPLLGASLALALVGCAPPSAEGLGTSAAAIQGGTVDAADTNVVDVVWLMADSAFSECSGTLIAPSLVLTAHHCVATIDAPSNEPLACATASFGAPTDASNLYVSTAEVMPMALSTYHRVRSIVVPPSSTGTSFCGLDEALLVLDDVVDPSEAAPRVPRVDGEVAEGEGYTAVGFGETMTGADDAGTRRELTGLEVACVGAACSALASGQIDTSREWIGADGTCDGDSGGPALDDEGRVVGVTSRGGSGCTAPIYGSVFAWSSWLKATATQAASEGSYATPVWALANGSTDPSYNAPIGGSCRATQGAAACPGAGTCVSEGGSSTCTRLCDESSPCPSGMICGSAEGKDVCLPEPTHSSGGSSGCAVFREAGPTEPGSWSMAVAALLLARRPARRTRRTRAR